MLIDRFINFIFNHKNNLLFLTIAVFAIIVSDTPPGTTQ